MRMERELAVVAAGVVMLSALASPVWAGTIEILNASFESPVVPDADPWAMPEISDWQKAPVPSWWSGAGYSDQQWNETAGTFLNVPFAPIDNVDELQAAFLFATPGVELFQDLEASFEVGQSYHLTIGMIGGGYGMKLGVPLEMRLYYRNDAGGRITLGSTTVTNTNNTGILDHLTDYQLDIPEVGDSDAWAGKSIGVQIVSTVSFEDMGGYWAMDNVRLEATPEPVSLAMMVFGFAALMRRQRRG